jgi:glutaminase
VGGRRAGVGDSAEHFTIQSVAEPFVFAPVCEAPGHRGGQRLGVNATDLFFDSVMAVELAARA